MTRTRSPLADGADRAPPDLAARGGAVELVHSQANRSPRQVLLQDTLDGMYPNTSQAAKANTIASLANRWPNILSDEGNVQSSRAAASADLGTFVSLEAIEGAAFGVAKQLADIQLQLIDLRFP